ncbi:MAG: DUF1501 domain-containing protein [Labilithrix sp.]|nr:DUF1501 domain-containing protein [Labilithrix sp.]MCW5815111.1 DUF1501 domain-containing protein [Labilithrix sp.]
MMKLSRRGLLSGFGAIAGASWIGRAHADATAKSAVVSIFFEGGFNAIFSSADSFAAKGSFGVTASNVKDVGNGLVVDASTIGTLGDWALGHMAAIGNRHGATDHLSAVRNNFTDGAQSYAVQLAAAMGGEASFKAVALGGLPFAGPSPSTKGVSLQLLRSMEDVSRALGLGAADPARPARSASGAALERSRQMSAPQLMKNPKSLSFARDAYATCVSSLAKPPLTLDAGKIAQTYGARSGGSLDGLAAKLAAAEMMLRSGTNVVTMSDLGWDTHGDGRGATVRRRMSAEVIPALKTFLARLRSEPELARINVSVILHGDFARSLPSSDHAPALSALVIGPNVKVGTTGRVTDTVSLKPGTGASREMWSYLAALSKVTDNPFGANPHAAVVA